MSRNKPRPQQATKREKRAAGGTNTASSNMAVGAIVAVFAFLAGSLALTQPMDVGDQALRRFSPPDESAHVAYFDELTTTWRLPIFTSGRGNYEAHQPPLYYLVFSPVYVLAARAGKPAAVIALRLTSVALGSVSIFLLWRICLLAFNGRRWPAAIAAAIGALWPARIIACSGVSNDAACELASLVALFVACKLATSSLTVRRAALAGAAVGLAMLVKSSALPLIIVGLVAIYVAWRRSEKTSVLHALGAFLGLFLLLWGPWAVRNTVLYGDPLAARAFEEIFKKDRATPEFFLSRGMTQGQYYMLVLFCTGLSFWGVFGQMNVWLPTWYYVVAGAWWAMTAGLIPAKAVIRLSEERTQWPVWALALLHIALVFALFLRFNSVFYQAQARYFLPASAGIGLALAWPWLWPRRPLLQLSGLALYLAIVLTCFGLYMTGYATLAVPFAPASAVP